MKTVKNILFWVTTVSLVFAILLVAVPKFFGVELRAVVTGSMEPELPVGSLVVIVPTEAEKLVVGNDVAFVTQGEKVVTHRLISIDIQNNEFVTRGIANDMNAIDPPNKYENIIGVVKLHIPYLGFLFSWLATLQGKIIAATIIVAIYVLSCILNIWTKDRKKQIEITQNSSAVPLQSKVVDELLESFNRSDEMFREAFEEVDNNEPATADTVLNKNEAIIQSLMRGD